MRFPTKFFAPVCVMVASGLGGCALNEPDPRAAFETSYIASPAVRPSGNNRAFVLVEPLSYEVGTTGITIEIPDGFVTDYASIPSELWSMYSPHDQYSRAAIVHDFLYWSQLCTRDQADNLFFIAMKESDVDESISRKIYIMVRIFGQSSWDRNQREKVARQPKIVPIQYRSKFPPDWSWEKYRQYLMKIGVVDPVFQGNDYCVFGESTEVPNALGGKANAAKKSFNLYTILRFRR